MVIIGARFRVQQIFCKQIQLKISLNMSEKSVYFNKKSIEFQTMSVLNSMFRLAEFHTFVSEQAKKKQDSESRFKRVALS